MISFLVLSFRERERPPHFSKQSNTQTPRGANWRVRHAPGEPASSFCFMHSDPYKYILFYSNKTLFCKKIEIAHLDLRIDCFEN